MKKIGVYILKCKNDRFYIGSSNDLDRRLIEHRRGYVKSTKNILPINLAFFHECISLAEARKIEYQIKRRKNKTIIEKIINDGAILFNTGR